MRSANFEPQIVITGDDFGISPAVNEAVERYHRAGALQQASLMVAEAYVEEAVAIARRNPSLSVGLHLTLCDGQATLHSPLAPHGRFISSPALAGLRYAFDLRMRDPLRQEIRRQFERFLILGFPPTYWDGHTHLHLHPLVFNLTLPIAQELGFKSTRLVREPGPSSVIPWIFHQLSAAAISRLNQAGIGYAERVFGLRNSGRMTDSAFHEAITYAYAHPGVTEIYFHPAAELSAPSPGHLASLLARDQPASKG